MKKLFWIGKVCTPWLGFSIYIMLHGAYLVLHTCLKVQLSDQLFVCFAYLSREKHCLNSIFLTISDYSVEALSLVYPPKCFRTGAR